MVHDHQKMEGNPAQQKLVHTQPAHFDDALRRLVGLFQLTEEEKKKAGIYVGAQRDDRLWPGD